MRILTEIERMDGYLNFKCGWNNSSIPFSNYCFRKGCPECLLINNWKSEGEDTDWRLYFGEVLFLGEECVCD